MTLPYKVIDTFLAGPTGHWVAMRGIVAALHARAPNQGSPEWVDPPVPRWRNYKRLRELNGLPPLSDAKVRGLLKKAGHGPAVYHRSGMVKGWGDWTSGYVVEYDEYGRIYAYPKGSRWTKKDPFAYVEVLRAAGIEVHEEDGRYWA